MESHKVLYKSLQCKYDNLKVKLREEQNGNHWVFYIAESTKYFGDFYFKLLTESIDSAIHLATWGTYFHSSTNNIEKYNKAYIIWNDCRCIYGGNDVSQNQTYLNRISEGEEIQCVLWKKNDI